MLRIIVILIFVIIVFTIVFITISEIIKKKEQPSFLNNINLDNLIDVTDIIPCPNGGKFVPELGMIVDANPVVATLACLNAPTDDLFDACESKIIPQTNDTLANPVAYQVVNDEIELLFAQRVAHSCDA